MSTTIHFAGTHVTIDNRLRQLCAWCGHRLVDLDLTRVGVEAGDTSGPPTWEVGSLVGIDGGFSWVVRDSFPGQSTALPPGTCDRLEAP